MSVEKPKKKATHENQYWRLEMCFVAVALESFESQETSGLQESDQGYAEVL
jgi:hypothetical protein